MQQAHNSQSVSRPVTSESSNNDSLPSEEYMTLPANRSDYVGILSKPYFYLQGGDWTTSDNPGNNYALANIRLPFDLLRTPQQKAAFNYSVFWRANICLEFQVLGSPFHMGTLIAYWKPTRAVAVSIADAMAGPHVLLSANSSTVACLEIPFTSPGNYAVTANALNTPKRYNFTYSDALSYMGTVNFMVLNRLAAPTGGNTKLLLTTSVTWKNLELHTPKIPLQEDTQSGVLASIAGAALPAASKFISDGISKGMKKFSSSYLDHPTNPLVDTTMRATTTTNFNNTEGVVLTDRLTTHTSFLSTATESTFPSRVDEMSYDYILSKPSFVGTFTISTATSSGAIVAICPISPICTPVDATADNSPLLQRMAYYHKYWTGSLNYTFHVAGSSMTVGKILVSQIYGMGDVNLQNFPTVIEASNVNATTLEISAGGQEHVVNCKYNAPTSYMYCQPEPTLPYQNGRLVVYSLSPLVTTASSPQYIEVNIFVSAGDDFSFHGIYDSPVLYGPNEINQSAGPTLLLQDYLDAQSGSVIPIAVSTDTALDTIPFTSNVEKKKHNGFVPPVTHFNDIVRRFYQVDTLDFDKTSGVIYQQPVSSILSGLTLASGSPRTNPLAQIASHYYGFKGGLRIRVVTGQLHAGIKILAWYQPPRYEPVSSPSAKSISASTPAELLISNNCLPFGVDPALPSPNAYSGFSTALVAMNQVDNTLDFEIPCESIFRFNVCAAIGSLGNQYDLARDLGTIFITITKGFEHKGIKGKVFASFADEAKLGVFTNLNTLVWPTSPSPSTWSRFTSPASIPATGYLGLVRPNT